ncbi:CopM family metallochaperone [Bosea sp. PAMC 26642]|uniref:CopM family metallochaperone n=1 Tax=Bosea sp. (strain PAMC 26642) TaxID=1792307 RepID=UPI000B16707D
MKHLTSTALAALLAGTLAVAGPVLAQQHQGHGMPGASAKDSASTTAFKAANMKMHKDMDIAFTGDPDADFVRGMIPHHQGAIDMARIMLAHGKDPALKALATSIIADQEKEIAQMRAWLKTNGK